MKKTACFLLSLILLFTLIPQPVQAEEASGELEGGLLWSFRDGTLILSGSGRMGGWNNYRHAPWYPYLEQIRSIYVSEGITALGSLAFAGCENAETVSLPDSLRRMYEGIFINCRSLTYVRIPDGIQTLQADTFDNCVRLEAVSLPESLAGISSDVFDDCDALTDIYFGGTREQWNRIQIYGGNEVLDRVSFHFGSRGPETPPSTVPAAPSEAPQSAAGSSLRITKVTRNDSFGGCQEYFFTYDEGGRLAQVERSGIDNGTVRYFYDAAGRYREKEINGNRLAVYTYDSGGLLTGWTDTRGDMTAQYRYYYDGSGILTSSTRECYGETETTLYTCDSTGQILEAQTPRIWNGGEYTETTYYTYDSQGRVALKRSVHPDHNGTAGYDETFTYNYDRWAPFTAETDSYGCTTLSLTDSMGHPIWDLLEDCAYSGPTDFFLDDDGKLILAQGEYCSWSFSYEPCDPPRQQTMPAEDYTLRLFSPYPEMTVEAGRRMQVLCALYKGDRLVEEWDDPSISIGPTDVLSYLDCRKVNGAYCITLTAHKEGRASIFLKDEASGARLEGELRVSGAASPYYSYVLGSIPWHYPQDTLDSSVKTNFYNVNGLYVTGLEEQFQEKNGSTHVVFQVYNTRYIHGSVDVFDASGKWIASRCIQKNATVRDPWGTLEDGFYAAQDFVTNWSYTASFYSQHTQIEIDVPTGGSFIISNNARVSPGTVLYNCLDAVLWAAAKTANAHLKTEAVQDAQEKMILELMADPQFMSRSYEHILEVGSQLLVDFSGDALRSDFVDVAAEVGSRGLDLMEYLTIDMNALYTLCFSAGGDILVELLPESVEMAYDGLFLTGELTDAMGQLFQFFTGGDNSVIRIFVLPSTEEITVSGVRVSDPKGNLPPEALPQVTWLPQSRELPEDTLSPEDYRLYDISFGCGGESLAPSGPVTVKLPIPEDWEEGTAAVYHQRADGTWEKLPSEEKKGYAVFSSDSFSLFALVREGSGEKKDGLPLWIPAVTALLLLSAVAVLLLLRARQKKHQRRSRRYLKR